ncbi:MAG: DNA-protecting protein DprA [Deltaproteobacteria bacterium]|nr:DNA-protecting protein DprA [Deltaproteobacteria bacterium]
MNSNDLPYWITLNRINGVGPATFCRLVDFFGSPRGVLRAGIKELTQVEGIRPQIAEAIVRDGKDLGPAEKELQKVERIGTMSLGARVIPYLSPEYPFRLKQTAGFPPYLYVRGNLTNFNEIDWLGVVGSRDSSEYGVTVCRRIVREVVRAGVGVVSGFARGIDITAHETALDSKGKTVAVLGCGLNIVYPQENARYVDAVLENGAFVTEFACDEQPRPEFFPRRNRIISGISRGVLVVEAGEKSGSLITAQYALDQNRDVYAVPGSVMTPSAKGSNRLIQQGARLVGSGREILDDWKYASPAGEASPHEASLKEDPEEASICRVCLEIPATPDDMVERTGLPAERVTVLLTKLELEGRIRSLPGGRYVTFS